MTTTTTAPDHDTVDATDEEALIEALTDLDPEVLLEECGSKAFASEAERRNVRLSALADETLDDLAFLYSAIEDFHRDHHGPGPADMCDAEPCRTVSEHQEQRAWADRGPERAS